MPNLQKFRPLSVALFAAFTLSSFNNSPADAQTSSRSNQQQIQAARATWSPTRTAATTSNRQSAPAPTLQPKSNSGSRVARPRTSKPSSSAVRQAAHQVPSPPPVEGEVIYEGHYDGGIVGGTIIDGSCDTMGSCGCDSPGCDAMGSCGPSCGCSMCGELPSGRAWRPAVTLSLPQDGWVSFEALHMRTDGLSLPPLITSSPSGTDRNNAGVLNRPGTGVMYGDDHVLDSFNGGRLRFGFWFDRCHTLGVGGEYFELNEESDQFSATSTGTPILARPFFNTLTGSNDAELIAFPNVLTGTATVNVQSHLVGGGFYFRKLTCCDEGCRERLFCGGKGHFCSRSEFRLGYRYMQLGEGVQIGEQLVSAGAGNQGTFGIMDSFDTTNQFNGLDLGWNHRVTRGYWTFDGLVRIAVGNTMQTVDVSGSTTIVDQTDPANQTTETYNAGFLALDSNSGIHEQDEFSVIPELTLTLGYQLTDHLKATVGYTGIYWSNVVRPGQHIPTMINPDYLPPTAGNPQGDAQPLFAFDTTDYWAHGITYGLEYRW
ncbi:BBP7 family outer membrane beta-barrel protein [Stieleria sp. TO1_6]|uniref:BBP7 family outer membrane beta-barrel protein n=1 Tax=Stieleria tagensis TaxID=2956795 RepID=UPI00209A76B6|nr:BBP7 family outer membrane beta-barrel protein [Stieleria tagensis]MCO8120460.1 BBP7 family outer membrane beta-barrel protein [Stieleria tagensis]